MIKKLKKLTTIEILIEGDNTLTDKSIISMKEALKGKKLERFIMSQGDYNFDILHKVLKDDLNLTESKHS
jgi:hypothetical protein